MGHLVFVLVSIAVGLAPSTRVMAITDPRQLTRLYPRANGGHAQAPTVESRGENEVNYRSQRNRRLPHLRSLPPSSENPPMVSRCLARNIASPGLGFLDGRRLRHLLSVALRKLIQS